MVLLSAITQAKGGNEDMNFYLPTILTLTASGADKPEQAETNEITGSALEARVAEALLGDALLTAGDLPATWRKAEPGASMLAGSDYDALALGDVMVAFEEPSTGRRIEQQLAVLPRWVARDLSATQSGAGAGNPSEVRDGVGVQVLERPVVSQERARIVRYGTLAMALRYIDPRAGALPAAIGEVADERCRELAFTLR